MNPLRLPISPHWLKFFEIIEKYDRLRKRKKHLSNWLI
ncbi:hypothetical protein X875_7920 [Mannheimia varigena USDA-ARS-USMARC-1388]|nr:hypothetical protein X875_7920 [Mannheimia varigena USDA-ARS-USMARC-1388]